jgi:hypothetical protein
MEQRLTLRAILAQNSADTARPSGRVNCGALAKRIGGGQARKRGKEGKPVAQRVTATTALPADRDEASSYAHPGSRGWWAGARGVAAPMHLRGVRYVTLGLH